MKKLVIAGITRGNEYSPNHIGNDAAIFNETVSHLQQAGYKINIYTEEEFLKNEITEHVIFNMVRNKESIAKLKKLEDNGSLVINSGYGIDNCTRERMTTLLINNKIPHPQSLIVNTNEDIAPFLDNDTYTPCWIKRGDFHAIHREDVSYVRNKEEANEILHEYSIRGIKRAVINQHLNGDLIKFYGIANSDFFYWFYPYDMKHSKFGLEKINGEAHGYKFDQQELKSICNKASQVLNIKIYGGDCIVDQNGTMRIIDFNDWPSFAPCRTEAAPFISQCILNEIALYEFKLVNRTLKLI
ncbi:MAG: hypothetical protein Q4F97_11710 [Bacteroidales bacterium]|nr:hypothetical protein [Bacteroidales bacterium]